MNKERYLHMLDVQHLMGRRIPCLATGLPALLVMDMQNYFLSSDSHAFVPSAPDLIEPLKQMVQVFQSKDLPVFFTRHLNTVENAGSMGRWWRDTLTEQNPLSKMDDAFTTSGAEVIVKSQYDAFLHTDLQDRLNSLQVTSVVVTGVMTNLCCETTARAAFTRGFDVVFPVDRSATYNAELHNATIINLSHGFTSPSCGEAVIGEVINGC